MLFPSNSPCSAGFEAVCLNFWVESNPLLNSGKHQQQPLGFFLQRLSAQMLGLKQEMEWTSSSAAWLGFLLSLYSSLDLDERCDSWQKHFERLKLKKLLVFVVVFSFFFVVVVVVVVAHPTSTSTFTKHPPVTQVLGVGRAFFWPKYVGQDADGGHIKFRL